MQSATLPYRASCQSNFGATLTDGIRRWSVYLLMSCLPSAPLRRELIHLISMSHYIINIHLLYCCIAVFDEKSVGLPATRKVAMIVGQDRRRKIESLVKRSCAHRSHEIEEDEKKGAHLLQITVEYDIMSGLEKEYEMRTRWKNSPLRKSSMFLQTEIPFSLVCPEDLRCG